MNKEKREVHIHKYIRHVFPSGYTIYKCVLACNHSVSQGVIIGREAICWRCQKPFTIGLKSSKQKKPHCNGCIQFRGHRKDLDVEGLEKLLNIG